MIESMTGFGEGKCSGGDIEVTVSARSVNHRYLDLSVRMPEYLRRHERVLTEIVRERLARGRIELRVDVQQTGEESRQVELRHGILRSYRAAIEAAQTEGLLDQAPTTGELLRMPEVVSVTTLAVEDGEEQKSAIEGAARAAVQALADARRAEGERLGTSLGSLLGGLEREVEDIQSMRELLRRELEERTRERFSQLIEDATLDADRVAMEVAVLVERTDIQEEVDRLSSHLSAFRDLLGKATPIGKKLDFLCQEILRELNTIGSKCRDTKAVTAVLEGKVVCEQLREQVQNIQ